MKACERFKQRDIYVEPSPVRRECGINAVPLSVTNESKRIKRIELVKVCRAMITMCIAETNKRSARVVL